MKKVLLAVLLVATLALVGCGSSQPNFYEKESIDRVVTGQVVTIDSAGGELGWDTLYFANNSIRVTVAHDSLARYNMTNAFVSVWTYNLHKLNKHLLDSESWYDVVSVQRR